MTGVCKYCGQHMMVDTDCQEKANIIATEECHCEEGRGHRNMEQWKFDAKTNIDALTEDVGDNTTRAMKLAVDAIAAGEKMKQVLYAVIDRKNADLIECVGTMAEVCAYEGKTENQIRSAICHAEKRGNKSRYIRIEVED